MLKHSFRHIQIRNEILELTHMTDYPELTPKTREIWDRNARWWDAAMGEGNRWHLGLIAPATERLLAIQPGERVLDLACGNGQFARRLAELGASVLACDFSVEMLECARERNGGRAEFRQIDLSSEEQLTTLGEAQFDAAVCTMALMDMASITPMLRAVHRALKPGGRFVFSVPHPCFNTNGTKLLAERDDYGDGVALTLSVKVTRYRTLLPERAVAIQGQPEPHFYFHRPLHTLLPACFDAGLVLDGIEEPAFEGGVQDFYVRWPSCSEIPPIFVARLRRLTP